MKEYYNMKRKFLNEIIIVKKGIFYYVYNEDSYIVNYLFNYKIINKNIDYVVFSDIKKVINKFKILDIGYIIILEKEIKKEIGDSLIYDKYLKLADEHIGKKVIIDKIIEKLYKLDIKKLEKLVLTLI